MRSKVTTVAQYLADLPDDRRTAIEAVRKAILANLPEGVQEGMSYGMIGYAIPHSVYPKGYHCDPKQPLPFASLASQKNHMALYLMNIYTAQDQEWLRTEWERTGRKLDMGKSCVRFKKLEDLPLDLIGKAIARTPVKKFIANYEAALAAPRTGPAKKAGAGKKKAAKKAATKR